MTNATPWRGTVLIAAITALAALGGTALSTWRQNRRAGREEWFRRVQWAEQLASQRDDDTRGAAGYELLTALAESPLATQDDQAFVLQLLNAGNPQVAEMVDEIEFDTDAEDDTPEEDLR